MSDKKTIEEPKVEAAIQILIDFLDKEGYENPVIDIEINVSDGRTFKMNFERTDLD